MHGLFLGSDPVCVKQQAIHKFPESRNVVVVSNNLMKEPTDMSTFEVAHHNGGHALKFLLKVQGEVQPQNCLRGSV